MTPHAPAVLDLLASGVVDPTAVFSGTVAFPDADRALLDLPARPLVLF